MKKMFLTAHSITTYPYAALNTDSTGRPKTTEQGGIMRGRISAPAIKHGMRKDFDNENNRTLHTRHGDQYITDELMRRGMKEGDAKKLASKAIAATRKESQDNDKEKDVMASFSEKQLMGICDLLMDGNTDEEDIKAAVRAHKSVDQICFGRMFAAKRDLCIEGAINVGHAFTTHKFSIETDWFTAIDDIDGVGHLGDKDGASGTFYKYMSINLNSLFDGLTEEGYDIKTTLRDVLSAFSYTQPFGGKHNHDNESLPSYIEFDIREDRPFSYSTAFDSAVQDEDGSGYAKPSIARLEEYAKMTDTSFGAPVKRFVFKVGETNLEELLDEVAKSVSSLSNKGEE